MTDSGPDLCGPLFSAVRLSAWRLLSLFAQISGRPSQAPDWPRPLPIHSAAPSGHIPRHTGQNLRCAGPATALHYWQSRRPSWLPSVAQRGFRATRRVDCYVDPAGCDIAVPDLGWRVFPGPAVIVGPASHSAAVFVSSRCDRSNRGLPKLKAWLFAQSRDRDPDCDEIHRRQRRFYDRRHSIRRRRIMHGSPGL